MKFKIRFFKTVARFSQRVVQVKGLQGLHVLRQSLRLVQSGSCLVQRAALWAQFCRMHAPTNPRLSYYTGTGKTLLARAVANRTDACFIRVIGSELVQKYVGEVRTAALGHCTGGVVQRASGERAGEGQLAVLPCTQCADAGRG